MVIVTHIYKVVNCHTYRGKQRKTKVYLSISSVPLVYLSIP
nr:MAG TPA: hypothetical protein [Caudoviricetes sp.]